MPRPISATISLPALTHNLNTVALQLQRGAVEVSSRPPSIWAVIKANAYGHGIDNAIRAFARADGLAMLDIDEAVRCRDAGWTKPIMLLEGVFDASDVAILDEYRLTAVIHCPEQIDMLCAYRPKRPIDVWVKLDTGMSRLGFPKDQFPGVYQKISQAQSEGVFGSVGKMTHFARADDDPMTTQFQLETFNTVTAGLPGGVSVCNSAASLTPGLWVGVTPSSPQWVRPGICLYGSSPFESRTAAKLGLLPAMTLASRLIGVRTIPAGASVGYGHRFTAQQPMRVGVVACGYADGYPRHASTGTPITVGGVPTRVVGTVSMDMLTVDLTPIPDAQVGTPVVLWGDQGPSVDEVATAAGTIGYELLCAVAQRVPKAVA